MLASVLLLMGCAHVTRKDIFVPSAPQSGALTDAQQRFSTARTAMLSALAHLPDAAQRLDAIDADCVRGAYDPAKAAQGPATTAVARVSGTLGKLPSLADAESRALDALSAAAGTASFTPAQRDALAAIVSAARTELAQVRTIASGQRSGWTAYSQLWAAETEWIYRAGAGFFPSQVTGNYDATTAGQAYRARTNPLRAAVEHERAGLADATATLSHDADAVAAAIDVASAAFGSGAPSSP